MRPIRTVVPGRRAAAVTVGVGLVGAALMAVSSSASADPADKSHDPQGAITSVRSVSGGVQVTGWAFDSDATSQNLSLVAKLDGGTTLGTTTTSIANAAVTKKYGVGPTPGYTLTVPVPSGNHALCAIALNIGHGTSGPVGCVALPVGRTWTSAQLAARQPKGAITSASATSSTVTFSGWATDPDWTAAHLRVVLYVDGSPARTTYSSGRVTPAVSGAGSNAAYTLTASVAPGTHVGCVWAVNIGAGNANSLLGCQGVDTRAGTTAGTVSAPTLPGSVLATALKHKGQAYSWGATGPTSFDCSGLVLYSYRSALAALNKSQPKNKQIALTLPRIAADQARAARLVPASRVQPGDLVFTFDSEGSVYHVGIYVKPGQAFAAIDYGYGVNYQNIWDPTHTVYGSFTHT